MCGSGISLFLAVLLFGNAAAASSGPHRPSRPERLYAAAQARRMAAARSEAAQAHLQAARHRATDADRMRGLAAAQAGRDRSRAIVLSAQARDAATRLRETETRAADTLSRIDALGARRQALQSELADDGAALAPLLPLIERLSLFPAETLLASQAKPADALSGLMVLRGLGAQLESRAEAIRARQLDLARLTAALQSQHRGLAALRQEQATRDQVVAGAADRAAAIQRASQDAADEAARQAAASAARATTLQDAVSRIEAAQRAAETQFQHEAEAAERASRPELARAARAHAASMSADAGPGLEREAAALPGARAAGGPVPGAPMTGAQVAGAPVAGRLMQAWGASTDAGPATGITYAPPAEAVVTAPCDGRIDFAGPFRSYGKMLILDCGHGYRFVLAGLDRLDVAVGQTLARGVAVGRMPDWNPAGSGGRPALYVQLRHGAEAIDPSGFLRQRS